MNHNNKKMLFIDACVSTHRSRTKQLCDHYLAGVMKEEPDTLIETVKLRKGVVEPLDKESIEYRNKLIEDRNWNDPMLDLARQFKSADRILIGAPYWDCSFPSILKVYIENIVVADLTFKETGAGFEGLCPCRELTYITTSGGPIGDMDLGYEYIKGIGTMLGIRSFSEYRAEGLDIIGADINAILEEAKSRIDAHCALTEFT